LCLWKFLNLVFLSLSPPTTQFYWNFKLLQVDQLRMGKMPNTIKLLISLNGIIILITFNLNVLLNSFFLRLSPSTNISSFIIIQYWFKLINQQKSKYLAPKINKKINSFSFWFAILKYELESIAFLRCQQLHTVGMLEIKIELRLSNKN
jgi:hypothetical protein